MSELGPVFIALDEILRPYAARLDIKTDSADELYADTRHTMKNGKPLFFGAVQLKKKYVSFHLMPVYVQPALLEPVSPGLKRRMQGKSCFNFTVIDEPLFAELSGLVEAGYRSYESQGYV